MKIELENGSIIESLNTNKVYRGKYHIYITENIKGTDTGKTCSRCGSKIFAYKRLNNLTDQWICSNRRCNNIL